jgi:iron complex outermembrane receptor protein
VVNLGATFRWSTITLGIHELVYGASSDYDNDGGQTNGEIMFYKNEIGVTPITNLELSWQAMEAMTLTVGATNLFDEYPDKRNSTYRAIQFESGDNGVVAGYPSFSPFGINGAYWYGKMVYRF